MIHKAKDANRDLICKTVECKDWGNLSESFEAEFVKSNWADVPVTFQADIFCPWCGHSIKK